MAVECCLEVFRSFLSKKKIITHSNTTARAVVKAFTLITFFSIIGYKIIDERCQLNRCGNNIDTLNYEKVSILLNALPRGWYK